MAPPVNMAQIRQLGVRTHHPRRRLTPPGTYKGETLSQLHPLPLARVYPIPRDLPYTTNTIGNNHFIHSLPTDSGSIITSENSYRRRLASRFSITICSSSHAIIHHSPPPLAESAPLSPIKRPKERYLYFPRVIANKQTSFATR
jgi:hypothetical protein